VAQRREQLFVEGLTSIFGARFSRGRFACRALVAAIVTLVTTQVTLMRFAGCVRRSSSWRSRWPWCSAGSWVGQGATS
jgi:hypothetical protein